MSTKYCYFNGKIIPENEAGIGVRDVGVLRSYGVFDFLRTYQGKLFHFAEHMDRFKHSAEALNIRLPISSKKLKAVLEELIAVNKFKEVAFRMVLSGGPAGDGMHYGRHPTFFILTDSFKPLPEDVFKKGAAIITCEHQREMPEVKTLNYLTAVKFHNNLKNKNILEMLYTWQGQALECTTSNFFIFRGDTLITQNKNILKGVTRAITLDLARDRFNIEERGISIEEVFSADEAFLTGSNKEIVPVVKIDGKKIGNGKVGENTKYLMRAFKEYVSSF